MGKVHIEKMDGVTLPPFYAHNMPWGTDTYRLEEHREENKRYGLSKLDAVNKYVGDMENEASKLGLGSDDLALILNMSANESQVPNSPGKQLAKAGISHYINYFVNRQFNTKKNVGDAIANAAIKEQKPETTVSAHVYFYKRV